MLKHDACALWGAPDELRHAWCVYEHYTPGDPPELIFVGACKLASVFLTEDGRNNSEWCEVTDGGKLPVLIRIIATLPDEMSARDQAVRHMRSFSPMPRCNVRGYNLYRASRRLFCSNGREYGSQTEAAAALNVSQSAISQHLKGHLSAVKGYTFAYQNPQEKAAEE